MLSEMRRKDRLEFWSEMLQVEQDAVCAALLNVSNLVSVCRQDLVSCHTAAAAAAAATQLSVPYVLVLYDFQPSVVESAVETAAKGDEQCAALLHTSLASQIAAVRPQLLELVDTFLEQLM